MHPTGTVQMGSQISSNVVSEAKGSEHMLMNDSDIKTLWKHSIKT